MKTNQTEMLYYSFGMLMLTISRHRVVSFAAARAEVTAEVEVMFTMNQSMDKKNSEKIIRNRQRVFAKILLLWCVKTLWQPTNCGNFFLAAKSLFWTLKWPRHAVIRLAVNASTNLKERHGQFLARCAAK